MVAILLAGFRRKMGGFVAAMAEPIKKPTTLRKFVVSTVGSGLIAAGISWWLFTVGSNYLGNGIEPAAVLLSDQSLSGYIGIVIGAAVALGGSFVAIMLAERAVESSNDQVKLTERANEIAERQTPEAQLASDAAVHYERLKGMLITVPSFMRRAQRDGCFAPGGDHTILRDLVGIVSVPVRNMLGSNVPATIASLAWTLETRRKAAALDSQVWQVQRQRYFEYAFSSISYDLVHIEGLLAASVQPNQEIEMLQMHLQRLLHAIFSLARHIDHLLLTAEKEEIRSSAEARQSELVPRGEAQAFIKEASRFSKFELSFIMRVMPAVKLNSKLWLGDDFKRLARESVRHLDLKGHEQMEAWPLNRDTLEMSQGGLILALHDSGHAEAIQRIEYSFTPREGPEETGLEPFGNARSGSKRPALIRLDDGGWVDEAEKKDGTHVPIFWITERAGDRLVQLQRYLDRQNGRWSKHIVVFDQVEFAEDSPNTATSKYLTLFDQLACRRVFAAVSNLCGAVQERGGGLPDELEEQHERVRQALKRARRAFHDNGSVDKLELPGGHYLTDYVQPMIEHAAAATDSVPEGWTGFALTWALQCNELLDQIQSDQLYQEDLADERPADGGAAAIPGSQGNEQVMQDTHPEVEPAERADPFHFVATCFTEFKTTMEELAKAPLLDRPWYAYAGIDHNQAPRDYSFPNTTFYGVAYIDSEFKIPRTSPLMEVLLDSRLGVYRLF